MLHKLSNVCILSCRGVHPPEAMMHFPPPFQISPLFSKNFYILWKISQMLPFPEKISDFHPPKFLMTFFFSHRPQILSFSTYFACFSTFPPDIYIYWR